MSITEKQNKNFNYVDWIRKAIENNFITYYDYNEFKNKKIIENSVGKIFKANWNNTNTNLVVKASYELDFKKIVNELKAQKEVNFHKNILQIYGISKLDNQYSLLLEYADGGSLYSYLKKSFTKLEWDDKYCLASQLANAIDFIHSKGVLFWLLSSGRRPFYDEGTQYDISLAMDIVNGKREEIIEDTPVEYSDIYTACWSDDIDERPSIQIVVSYLKSIIDYSANEIENNDLKYMMNDYDDLSIYDNFSKIMIDDDFSLNTFDYVKNNLLILNLTDSTNNVEKIVDKLINHLIRIHDELCYFPIETREIINQNIQDIDKNKTSSKYIFFRGFLYYNGIIIIEKDEYKAFKLFLKASKDNYPIAQFYLGKLYKDPKKAFYWYQKSAENGSKLAQFYLGKCYENGNGIEKDYDKSIEWFEKSARQGYIITQLGLGILYEKEKKDFENSFYWTERAIKKGRKFEQSHIGTYYDNCLSAQKEDFEPFELFERSAKQGCYSAIYILGHLYLKGIGSEKQLKESVHLIEKEAIKGNKHAQLYLGRFYEEGIIVEKSCVEAFKWYKNAANDGNKYAQLILGFYFEKGGSGFVEKDIKKAVWWYEKSAEQEYSYAQCCLGYLYEKGEEIDRDSRKAIYCGRRPFYDEDTQYDISLATEIVNGKREEIIKDTPVEYSDIYTACWSDDPDERPSIQIVVSCLKSIIDYSIKSITNEIENHSIKSITNEIENNDLKYMMDDYDLSIYDNFSKIMLDDNSSLNTFDFVKNKLLILNLTNLTDNVEKIVDKLIDHLIRIHDELCYIPTEAKEIINQNIQNIDKFLQIKIFDWLIRNQTSSKYIFFRGFLYYNGIIIIDKDEDKALRLFSKASKDNYPIAQFYLGKLYKDSKKAFYWYQKSAENGSKLAQFYLGKCYENGNGIEKDYDKSIEWFEKSASQGYIITQLLLGILYEKLKKDFENSFCWIERVMKRARKFKKSHISAHYDNLLSAQKDDFKLFELYERSAEQGCYSAIYILGHLYINGIGFGKKLKESVHLIEKAAKKGNKKTQLYLAKFYEEGIIVEKSRVEAFKWYKNAANDGIKYAQVILGLYFEKGGYGFVKKDIKKAVWWYEKSAEQDYAYAQCCLGYLYEKGEEIDRDSRKAIYWYKKAAENGYDAAYYLLAKFYEVVVKNEAKAFKYIKYYIEKGHFKGMYVLIGYYKRGIGTDIDREKADNLLKIATKIKKLKKTDTIS
ncbi:HCP-like protein [Rhizophagus irregularis]|uniref:HCP-like protein n=1 Tax=Rhizophagus irregularis TaxID=588596 RepID=A0A2N1MAS3_9GLOM|nr:HCP-like protein [Rhizophagus irregularis]